jgi:uncharacterized protein YeaO (DUF488 family)
MKPTIKIKRVYEKPHKKDGYRVLVDRLWPRGITKEDAALDEWAKDLAPSTYLRKWFDHDPALWTEFQKLYRSELKHKKAVDAFMESHEDKKVITLLYSAKDIEHTHAIVLQQYLEEKYATS